MNIAKEENVIISYAKRKDALKLKNYDGFCGETLKNCPNLCEEDIYNNYRIVVSLNSPAKFEVLLEDVLSFCKRYDFLRYCGKGNPVFTADEDIVSIDFYLKKKILQ